MQKIYLLRFMLVPIDERSRLPKESWLISNYQHMGVCNGWNWIVA
jgi:hypothetical protein